MTKRLLTDVFIRNLKAAPPGKRIAHWDTSVGPGFGVIITDRGVKSFVLYVGSSKYKIGSADRMSLADARDKARDWLAQLRKGINPHTKAKQAKAEAQLSKERTFGAVAETFIAERLAAKRHGKKDAALIRLHILPKWGKRPIGEITRSDAVALIKPLATRVPTTAHHVHNAIGRIFNWAIAQDIYGVEHNPVTYVKAKDLIGQRRIRTRVLTDIELRTLWQVCEDVGYPYGKLYKLLMLTGVRIAEAAGAKWTEFDLDVCMWTIPAERYKSEQEHRLPLSKDAIALLKSLPRFARTDFVFTNGGGGPVNSFSRSWGLIIQAMKDALGEQESFGTHDIRRTVRTRLSPLAPYEVCELIVGHAKRGLARVYDQHRYEKEQRKALDAWARSLRSIISGGAGANVVEFAATGTRG
jgi:integrase